jgi:hypothetical protein
MKSDVTATTMADRKPKKELAHIEVHPGEAGGAALYHVFTHYEHPKEGPHIFGSEEGQKMVAHLSKHLGMEMGSQKSAAGKSKSETEKSEAEEV